MCCNKQKELYQDLSDVLRPAKQTLKICLVGDIAVGKSSLTKRFVGHPFDGATMPTVAMDLEVVSVALENGTEILVRLWDTAGQERFNSVAVSTLRGADAVILVYALNSIASLNKLMYYWYPAVRQASPDFKEVLLVGNKSDLESNLENADELLASFCELLKEDGVRFVVVRFSAAKAEQEACAEVFSAFVRRVVFSSSTPEVGNPT